MAEKKHNIGKSLYDGGYKWVVTSVAGEGFVVFSVQSKNCNRGGMRNSGITIWEGWYASNGEKEVILLPIAMWRDGENQDNDRPWNKWSVKEVVGDKVVFRNHEDEPKVKTIRVKF